MKTPTTDLTGRRAARRRQIIRVSPSTRRTASMCRAARGVLMLVLCQLSFHSRADMYDLLTPHLQPTCPHGCARWRDLKRDGSTVFSQAAADRMWMDAPPSGAGCAMPGRAVQCCNMWNASLTGQWPNCRALGPDEQQARQRRGRWSHKRLRSGMRANGEEEWSEEYTDKAGLGDSPLCYPQFPSGECIHIPGPNGDECVPSPGFNGAFCFCKAPTPGEPVWSQCQSPPRADQSKSTCSSHRPPLSS